MHHQPLSARNALTIAAQHGFSIRHSPWERQLIRDYIIEAREAWHNGPRKTAEQHFDGFMARTREDIREDSKTY